VQLHQLTAAIYLVAGLAAGVGLVLPSPRLGRAAVALLGAGVLTHAIAFSTLHTASAPPPLTDLPTAMSFMSLVGAAAFLLLLLRVRFAGLIVLVAPMAFLGVFTAALRIPTAAPATFDGSGSWPHAHVLLASAGLSLLGLAGLAGLLFLAEHRRLKSKRPLPRRRALLPSLEALDRVNAASLAAGFALLTLGVLTGMIWLQTVNGRLWTGTPHQIWSGIAWVVYAGVVSVRFGSDLGSRQAAAFAAGGFAFLCFAVIGVGLFA
jgi:ABC-type transport system involved in cytochrome c biogenesis permease subunit